MMLDILAVQRLYGVATSGPLTGGGHTFGFNSNIEGYIGRFYDFNDNINKPIITLWENGTNNTLDLSGFSQDAIVNLTPGTFSSVGGHVNNLAIAFGTVIEKAIGGEGNDTITASNVASTLMGGDGSDKLYGGAGNDMLTGGEDPDTFDPGGGLNILRDILQNMNGDTVFNFGLSTTIDILGRRRSAAPTSCVTSFAGNDHSRHVGQYARSAHGSLCRRRLHGGGARPGQQRAHDGDVRALPAQPVRGRARRCPGGSTASSTSRS